jgi:hypothetical protein
MSDENCKNCGGDKGIHHYQTMQCPVGGREETRTNRTQEFTNKNKKIDKIFFPSYLPLWVLKRNTKLFMLTLLGILGIGCIAVTKTTIIGKLKGLIL